VWAFAAFFGQATQSLPDGSHERASADSRRPSRLRFVANSTTTSRVPPARRGTPAPGGSGPRGNPGGRGDQKDAGALPDAELRGERGARVILLRRRRHGPPTLLAADGS